MTTRYLAVLTTPTGWDLLIGEGKDLLLLDEVEDTLEPGETLEVWPVQIGEQTS